MSDNPKSQTLVTTSSVAGSEASAPSLRARVVARLRANKFDRLAAVGGAAPDSGAYAAHCARLTSTAEREAVARALRRVVLDARGRGPLMSSRVPLHVPNITAAEDVIDEIALRLHSPRMVGRRAWRGCASCSRTAPGPFTGTAVGISWAASAPRWLSSRRRARRPRRPGRRPDRSARRRPGRAGMAGRSPRCGVHRRKPERHGRRCECWR